MKETVLAQFPNLTALLGPGGYTLKRIQCELCSTIYPSVHKRNAKCAVTCDCGPPHNYFYLGGSLIIEKCCGEKVMRIVADLMPYIAHRIAPTLRKRAKELEQAAKELEGLKQI